MTAIHNKVFNWNDARNLARRQVGGIKHLRKALSYEAPIDRCTATIVVICLIALVVITFIVNREAPSYTSIPAGITALAGLACLFHLYTTYRVRRNIKEDDAKSFPFLQALLKKDGNVTVKYKLSPSSNKDNLERVIAVKPKKGNSPEVVVQREIQMTELKEKLSRISEGAGSIGLSTGMLSVPSKVQKDPI